MLLWNPNPSLDPIIILHIAVFVHFCEAFFRIEPHFELFRSLYVLTPQPSAEEIGCVGCADLQLRPEAMDKYLEWSAIRVDPDWI